MGRFRETPATTRIWDLEKVLTKLQIVSFIIRNPAHNVVSVVVYYYLLRKEEKMIEVCMTQLEAQQPELAANLSVSSLESNILHLPLHVEKKEQPKKLADHEQDPLLLHP